ncbi:unnamed protein product [Triticum turgidum subsp. durum]|uniref:Cytochrome P450 n=1 Tax=Triticum turgidum subsp. durum TaxID=4567 RepID=A0A9R0YM52_TRITD|nr:unnamed protein product [Triticum turgidum subsp. durum]
MAGRTFVDAAVRAMQEYVRVSDLALAAAVLFACNAATTRLKSRGRPMLWPVFGIIPTLFAHLDNIYDWGAAALARSGGTFPYRGMWGGGSSGVITSVPANVEHEALQDDVLPDGTAIRARQRVIYNTYAIGRDPAAWGEDCLEFRPERWMKGRDFAGGAESPFKYVVFNGGPRLCVGKRFAYTQMKTLAAAVLETFAVEVAPGQVVKPKLNTTLYMKNGLMRKNDGNLIMPCFEQK